MTPARSPSGLCLNPYRIITSQQLLAVHASARSEYFSAQSRLTPVELRNGPWGGGIGTGLYRTRDSAGTLPRRPGGYVRSQNVEQAIRSQECRIPIAYRLTSESFTAGNFCTIFDESLERATSRAKHICYLPTGLLFLYAGAGPGRRDLRSNHDVGTRPVYVVLSVVHDTSSIVLWTLERHAWSEPCPNHRCANHG